MTRFLLMTIFCVMGIVAAGSTRGQDIPTGAPVQETPATDKNSIPIWPEVAPGSEGWTQKEVEYNGLGGDVMIRNVVTPTLTVFSPEPGTLTGAAVIVCPGGGFRFLSWKNEGTDVAKWLQKRGVTAFVLKYRLKETPADEAAFSAEMLGFLVSLAKLRDRDTASEAMKTMSEDLRVWAATGIADGKQAIKFVRQSAKNWNLKPDRIGIMGFSAGAMITNGVCAADELECRPDFAAPIYGPVFGEIKVPRNAPPLFILCASDDSIAEVSSVRLYSAWRDAGQDAELHIFEKGGHGFGMSKKNLPVDGWINRFGDWLKQRGYVSVPKGKQ